MSSVQRIWQHFLFHEKQRYLLPKQFVGTKGNKFCKIEKTDLCTLSFYGEYWGLVSRRAWMKAFRSFSTLSFFPSSRCSWRSARTRLLEAARGWGWEGLIHFLVVGSSFGVMMITSNLVLLFLFSWASRRLLSHTVKCFSNNWRNYLYPKNKKLQRI